MAARRSANAKPKVEYKLQTYRTLRFTAKGGDWNLREGFEGATDENGDELGQGDVEIEAPCGSRVTVTTTDLLELAQAITENFKS